MYPSRISSAVGAMYQSVIICASESLWKPLLGT
jgi:hypothetical protein